MTAPNLSQSNVSPSPSIDTPDYADMTVVELKRLITERRLGGVWTQTAAKTELIAVLESGVQPMASYRPTAAPSSDTAAAGQQIAAILASLSAAPASVNPDQVKAIVADQLAPMTQTLRSAAAAVQSLSQEIEALRTAQQATSTRELSIKLTDAPAINVGLAHETLPKMTAYLAALKEKNVYLFGASGSGKTHSAEQLAAGLQWEFYPTPCDMFTERYQILGYRDATACYVPTAFYKGWKDGGIVLLDELDRLHPNSASALNMALANGVAVFGDEVIKRNPDCWIIATGNTDMRGATNKHAAGMKQDAALPNRFAFIQWDYDQTLEVELASNKKWCNRVQSIRAAAKDLRADTVTASTRAILEGQRLIAAGIPQDEVEFALIWQGCTADLANKIDTHARLNHALTVAAPVAAAIASGAR